MRMAYGWAFLNPLRKVYYNLTVTIISVMVAWAIGSIELLQVLSTEFNLRGGFWLWVNGLNFEAIGYGIVGLFVGILGGLGGLLEDSRVRAEVHRRHSGASSDRWLYRTAEAPIVPGYGNERRYGDNSSVSRARQHDRVFHHRPIIADVRGQVPFRPRRRGHGLLLREGRRKSHRGRGVNRRHIGGVRRRRPEVREGALLSSEELDGYVSASGKQDTDKMLVLKIKDAVKYAQRFEVQPSRREGRRLHDQGSLSPQYSARTPSCPSCPRPLVPSFLPSP